MSILNQKKKAFGNIAALRTLTEGMPSLKTSSSFPSINNNGDTTTFLCDLIKSLVGYDALVQTITDTLVYSLSDVEREIKSALKIELKSIVSCGINPSLPAFIKSTGTGIKFTVDKIDFTSLMLVDPNSEGGKILYNDRTPNLIDSSDFNTFLYQTIQNNGSIESWGHTTSNSDILTFGFKSLDVSQVDPNNTLTVKAHPTYDTKTLTELNNDFIDSVTLFNTENLLTNIIDSIFGTVSNIVNKSLKQLENEAKTNTIIDKIVNSDSNDIISDKYFTFTNEEINKQQEAANARMNGVKTIITSNPISTSIAFSTINDFNSSISSATTQNDKKDAVSTSLNQMGAQVAGYTNNPVDHEAVKLNFIQEIINTLTRTIVNSILSPKVIAIFIINYKIIYGPNATFSDAIDFLKKNKNLIQNLTKRIGGIIIKVLLKIALKKIAELVAEGALKQQIDKAQSNVAQLLSLVGVSQDMLRQIKGFL